MKYKYEVGGEVEISGQWYEVKDLCYSYESSVGVDLWNNGEVIWFAHEAFITDYRAPKPKEWITEGEWDQWEAQLPAMTSLRVWANTILNEKYGEPTK